MAKKYHKIKSKDGNLMNPSNFTVPVSCPASVLIPSRVFLGLFLTLGKSAFGAAEAKGDAPVKSQSNKPIHRQIKTHTHAIYKALDFSLEV